MNINLVFRISRKNKDRQKEHEYNKQRKENHTAMMVSRSIRS